MHASLKIFFYIGFKPPQKRVKTCVQRWRRPEVRECSRVRPPQTRKGIRKRPIQNSVSNKSPGRLLVLAPEKQGSNMDNMTPRTETPHPGGQLHDLLHLHNLEQQIEAINAIHQAGILSHKEEQTTRNHQTFENNTKVGSRRGWEGGREGGREEEKRRERQRQKERENTQ